MNRQEYWLNKGYTKEQIENHLKFERRKSKESRERRKKNNLKNKELIKQIKEELVGQIFKTDKTSIKILSISPSVDGVGFWFKIYKTFSDNSGGNFKYFEWFSEYKKNSFIENLKYL